VQLPPAKPALQLASSDIPDKLYFRIGEVSRLAGVKPYVLRYWETEFASIAPKKSGTGHRLYRRKDVEIVLEIKRLLYEKRFTIEGARKALESRGKATVTKPPSKKRLQRELFQAPLPDLTEIRQQLRDILDILR
jgi:DNA-binding transcriptional MerR regulator